MMSLNLSAAGQRTIIKRKQYSKNIFLTMKKVKHMEPISKKKIATLYTQISQEIFNVGVNTQKIDIIDNKILILAKYKKMLKQKVELLFDIQVTSLFRDYDPVTENSCTVICFK